MDKNQILQKLRVDEEYYGEFGNQFLSNSHIGKITERPFKCLQT
jgi:hypothetical protein